ncbi:DmsE family decaheme c-type cytochrome [Edaphobacter paludis]|uniref:DmsE family decaheme c-type cytochrome n=1 Tax=Edaphobacter paludis TaxID=3035702 RepID=A0AAU7DD76_9BACT
MSGAGGVVSAQADGALQPQTAISSRKAVLNPTDYVGSETCALCHADLTKKFDSNPHSKLVLMHGGKGVTCESCHGSAKAHVESGGDVTKIFRFTKATPKEVDQKCLSCHLGTHANFDRSAHGAAGVSCIGCHSNHAFQSEAHLLKVEEPKLCYSCHTDVKAAFAQPFHHKVNEGLLVCTDCHNPHGTFQDKLLKTNADQNAVCTKCHAETLGPFVYEHPPLKLEGCTSCHLPHGSPNARLLNRSNVNSLCLQCHSASMNFTAPGTPSFHNQANQYQACTNCHVQIHGSNASNVFFK